MCPEGWVLCPFLQAGCVWGGVISDSFFPYQGRTGNQENLRGHPNLTFAIEQRPLLVRFNVLDA